MFETIRLKSLVWPAPAVVMVMGLCCGVEAVDISASSDSVGRYERIEFYIEVGTNYADPYDPAVVDVSVELTGPDGNLAVPGFFEQKYEKRRIERGRNAESWFYPVGTGSWTVRFTPMKVGEYSARAVVKDSAGTRYSDSIRFACTDSAGKGYLRTGRKDPRFFEFDNGEHFFVIGQNVAFIGEGQYVNLARADQIFGKLADNGANFVRVWTCCADWAMCLEGKKSAWERSWGANANIVEAPGGGRKCVRIEASKSVTCNPSHPVALKGETRYAVSGTFTADGDGQLELNLSPGLGRVSFEGQSNGGQREFRAEFTTGAGDYRLGRTTLAAKAGTVYLGQLSLKQADGGAELLWEADVNRRVIGTYNQLDCAMLDEVVESAEKHGIYLMLCVVTRDLYMKSLSKVGSEDYAGATAATKNFLRYCVARWGYSTAVGAWEYFNEMDPGKPTNEYYDSLGRYLEQLDVYHHLRTTSTWHPSARDIRQARIDIGQLHHYMRPDTEEDYSDEVGVIIDKTRFLRENGPSKPVLIGEFGLATPKWGLSDAMKSDAKGVHFRRSLWASAFAGSSGTAMFWWWDTLDRQDSYGHYKPLAEFLEGVSFAGLRAADADAGDGLRVLGYQGPASAHIWISDRDANWRRQVMDGKAPQTIAGAKLQVRGLTDGAYRVRWWDSQKGGWISQVTVRTTGGVLECDVPQFSADIACRIER